MYSLLKGQPEIDAASQHHQRHAEHDEHQLTELTGIVGQPVDREEVGNERRKDDQRNQEDKERDRVVDPVLRFPLIVLSRHCPAHGRASKKIPVRRGGKLPSAETGRSAAVP